MYVANSDDRQLSAESPDYARTDAPYHSRAYGLVIRSDFPLPEFSSLPAPTPADVDVEVSFSDDLDWIDSHRGSDSFWSVSRDQARFWFKGVGGFTVCSGHRIAISPEPAAGHDLLRLYVEGMMMACILQQRGYFVLHSSVIQIGDGAIALLGHVGAGKSSLAAALHARGHAVVTDDNAAIDTSTAEPLVLPAFPSVKVYPAVAATLGYSEHSLRLMHTSQLKRAASVNRAFPAAPVPLRGIYVLDREWPGPLTLLTRAEASLELIRNSVPTRWGQNGDAAHLMNCGNFSGRLPLWRIRTFHSLTEIPALARTIEQNHLATETPAA